MYFANNIVFLLQFGVDKDRDFSNHNAETENRKESLRVIHDTIRHIIGSDPEFLQPVQMFLVDFILPVFLPVISDQIIPACLRILLAEIPLKDVP